MAWWVLGASVVLISPPIASADPIPRPNILLLISDDQAWSTFNRDLMPSVYAELVDQGLLFDRAYVNSSLCCPSRSQIMTGLYEHHTGVDENRIALDRPTLPAALHDRGYRTILAGKYLNSWPCGPRAEFDAWHCVSTPPPSSYTMIDPWINDDGAWVHHSGYQTDILAADVTDFISSTPTDQPFFAIYSPTTPHMPADDPRYTFPAPLPQGPSFNPNMNLPANPMYLRRLPQTTAEQATDAGRFAAMSHAVRSLDDAVGSILGSLGDRADDTLVIYLSDNGYQFGEHGRLAKTTPYEETVRVPMIIRYPALHPADQPAETSGLVENVDIAATIAQLLAIPWGADGVSFLPLISGSAASGRDAVLIERCRGIKTMTLPCTGAQIESRGQARVPAFEGVVTHDTAYIRYPLSGEAQLFDLTTDPLELVDRAGDPTFAGVEATMRAQLDALMAPPPVDTTIVTGADGPLDSRTATFTYFSQSRFATYGCRLTLDGVPGPWHPCNGQRHVEGGLVDGDYVFEVAGTDEFGSTDPTPASRTFSVHTDGPAVSIVAHPPARQTSTQLSFGFSTSLNGATFECRLAELGRTGPWDPCDQQAGVSTAVGSDGFWHFEVRATDPSTLAVTDPPAAWLVEVDTVGPEPVLIARPPTESNSPSATFAFVPSEGARPSVRCKLDATRPVDCSTGSYTTPSLGEGTHKVAIIYTDLLGNRRATRTRWSVDTTAPTAAIKRKPSKHTSSPMPTFKIGSSETTFAFRCQMDAGPIFPCRAKTTFPPLADGQHAFTGYALDGAGNVSLPVSFTWTIDTVAPIVTVTGGPQNGAVTTSREAAFTLGSNEAGAFWCSLDGAVELVCASPATYSGLGLGSHTFSVYATDTAGNASAPVSRAWTVTSA